MLFLSLTPESYEQASFAAAVVGLVRRLASQVARPANLAKLIMVAPKVYGMAQAAVRAGLFI